MSVFCWPARVYWEDTDGGGVVYYANYLKYLERARTEWLRTQGVSQQSLAREQGIVFAVTSIRLDYRRPARLDDELLVSCEPRTARSASVSFVQHVYRRKSNAQPPGELLASGEVRIACLDAATFRPQRLPSFMLSALNPPEPS